MTTAVQPLRVAASAPWWPAVLSFVIAALLSSSIVWHSEILRVRQHREVVELLGLGHVAAIQRDIDRALSITYPLSVLVQQARGAPQDFETVAKQLLPLYQGSKAVVLAPNGVISQVVPHAGNEKAIGLDLLKDPARGKEAILARDSGTLTWAGPFTLMHGGLGAAGRLPLYADAQGNISTQGVRANFWGFVVVILQFPEVLRSADLSRLATSGHHYELWRFHPDTGQRQSLSAAGEAPISPVDLPVVVPNASWTLSVAPAGGWGNPLRLSGKIALALLFSLLLAWAAHLLARNRRQQQDLERRIDAATQVARDRETRLRDVVEASPVPLALNNDAGQITYLNAAFVTTFGYTQDDIATLDDWYPLAYPDPAYRQWVADSWQARLKAAKSNQHGFAPRELLIRAKDGTERTVMVGAALMASGQEHLVTLFDITQQKRIERDLNAERTLLSALFNALPDLVWLKDADGKYLSCNKRFESFVGAPLERIIGKTDYDFVDAQQADAFWDYDQRAIASGQPSKNNELVRFANDGHEELLETTKTPIFDAHQQLIGVLGVGHDITERNRVTQALAESELHYRKLFSESSIVMLVIDPQTGQIADANPAAAAFYGYPLQVLTSLNINAINTMVPQEIKATMARTCDQGPLFFEFRHQLASGAVRDVQVSSGAIVIKGQSLLMSTVLDVTEQHIAQARMRQALVVFNASSQGIVTTDANALITAVNPAFTRITGYEAQEVLGRNPSMFKSGRQDSAFYQNLWGLLRDTGRWEGEIWNRRRNGDIYPQWLTIAGVRDSAGDAIEYVAMFSDITERKQQQEAIWHQANFDALTGLTNRNLFIDRLERSLAGAKRNGLKVGLAFMDLDGFKWINDTLGHDVGDLLLIEVGRRLGTCVREQDTAARLGGDEFTVVIHDLGVAEDMLGIGEKLVGVLRDPFVLAGASHQISGSVGITVFPDDGEDVQTLLKNADIAMYKAKQAGKNRFEFYTRHMQVDAHARMEMETDLRHAIEAGEFLLYYQPIVDADSGELVGAEALLRWQHATRGMVSPLDFVPVAEDCGLIVPIGEWVLREAARQLAAWRDKGYAPLRMSVNVSSVQFHQPNLEQMVAGVLQEFNLAPGMLMLEITESVLMDGSAQAEARMRSIKNLGVAFALDDFGTGFSSLSYLKRFPVDIVKIDRSFVNDCPDDRNDAHLVEAIINMAHSLDLRVTAEGVETEAQFEFLRNLGCDYLQGYLAGRPLPAANFEVLIERRLLLLPTDGASDQESRFLAALRQDELNVEEWLERLLSQHQHKLADYQMHRDWQTRGLDLRQAVQVHLAWRRRLDHFVNHATPQTALDVQNAGSAGHCQLGRWIADHKQGSDNTSFERLDQAHQAFHQLAGQIVDDQINGHRALARRTLTGVAFRKTSREVVMALIACYSADLQRRTAAQSAPDS